MKITEIFTQKSPISWGLRILVSILFLVSAYGKLYTKSFDSYLAISGFEQKQLVGDMGFSDTLAIWFSRILIGAEFALGILILLPYRLKKFTIPASLALLGVFVIYLCYQQFSGQGQANCGCFGQLIKMSTASSIFKNLITIGMLLAIFRLLREKNDNPNFMANTSVFFASTAIVTLVTFPPIKKTDLKPIQENIVVLEENDTIVKKDIFKAKEVLNPIIVDTAKATPKIEEPKKKVSEFAKFFSDIDKGKKLMCFFSPGCEHCLSACKAITKMRKKNKSFPEIRIVFMEEEVELIPDFFKKSNAPEYMYKILDIPNFYKATGKRNTPIVSYLWNGNVIQEYEGTLEGNPGGAFEGKEKAFETLINKTWEELK